MLFVVVVVFEGGVFRGVLVSDEVGGDHARDDGGVLLGVPALEWRRADAASRGARGGELLRAQGARARGREGSPRARVLAVRRGVDAGSLARVSDARGERAKRGRVVQSKVEK